MMSTARNDPEAISENGGHDTVKYLEDGRRCQNA